MDATPFRRVGARLEIHARLAPAGRTPHVVDGTDLLVLVGADAARLRCCGRARALPPDFLAVLDTGEVLVLDLPETTECRSLHFAPGLLQEVARSVPVLPDVLSSGRRVAWVMAGAHLCELADAVNSEEGAARLIEQVTANGGRCRLAPEEHVDHAVVSRVRDILRDDFARKVTLTELGTLVGMRRSALVRAFTREVGMPPHAYRTHVRVLRARELIAAGHPLSDVSLEVGFNDQSHLNRHFKRLMGITPGMYARAASALPMPTLQTQPPPWVARTSGDAAANNLQSPDARRLHLQGEASQPRFSGSDTTHIVVNPPR